MLDRRFMRNLAAGLGVLSGVVAAIGYVSKCQGLVIGCGTVSASLTVCASFLTLECDRHPTEVDIERGAGQIEEECSVPVWDPITQSSGWRATSNGDSRPGRTTHEPTVLLPNHGVVNLPGGEIEQVAFDDGTTPVPDIGTISPEPAEEIPMVQVFGGTKTQLFYPLQPGKGDQLASKKSTFDGSRESRCRQRYHPYRSILTSIERDANTRYHDRGWGDPVEPIPEPEPEVPMVHLLNRLLAFILGLAGVGR
ncbi:hypothetical protein PQX77_005353 [Marasmius sp. AFHP31]|nr:hypothetical protein PQX77_005353 [Marasmius sp. AFHP31]